MKQKMKQTDNVKMWAILSTISISIQSRNFLFRFLVQTFPFSGTDIPEVNVKNNTSQHLNHSTN